MLDKLVKRIRKLFHADTGKVRLEAYRENMHRACQDNQDAASQLIKRPSKTTTVSSPEVHGA